MVKASDKQTERQTDTPAAHKTNRLLTLVPQNTFFVVLAPPGDVEGVRKERVDVLSNADISIYNTNIYAYTYI